MNESASGLARSARILNFLLKYKRAGVFEGLDIEQSSPADGGQDGTPDAFVADLESLGPAFIKLGQALSTRADMMPPAYLAALERIQDNVHPLDATRVRSTIETELGVRLSRLFVEFDDDPLGSASLAQVHKAALRDGREVAVKVQRPDVEAQILADLDILGAVANRADRSTRIGRRLHFSDWVREFRRTLLDELDFRLEAENLERFSDHLRDYPALLVPQPVRDYCTPRVLTMALVKGVKVNNLSGLRRTEQDFDDLAADLLRGYLDQAFVHGEIHADPHPGNLLVTDDGRLAIFDLGMVAHVSPRRRDDLLKLLFSAVDGRGEEVAAQTIALSVKLDDFDEMRFERETGQLVARYCAHNSADQISEGQLMLHVARVGAACGLRPPAELNVLARTLLNLEGICAALAPRLRMREVVGSHLQQMMWKRLRRSFSPASIASETIEMQALMQQAPRQVSAILSLLAENRFRVDLGGLRESMLTENLQKIANRVATGVIVAALILASALLMQTDLPPTLWGYPAIALTLFVVASALGLGIVISALITDRRARPRAERRGPGG